MESVAPTPSRRWFTPLVLVILVGLGLLLAGNAYKRYCEQAAYQAALLGHSAAGAARLVELFLDETRRRVALFAAQEREAIARLARDPEDPAVYRRLAERVKQAFPAHFAFTVADAAGEPLWVDFDGRVGEVCLADIRRFAAGDPQQVFIHPNPFAHHFDIMVRVEDAGPAAIFFVSFEPTVLARILAGSELPPHRLLLLHREVAGLVEVSAAGSRVQAGGTPRLSEAQRARLVGEVAVPGTRWRVTYLPDGSVLAARASALAWEASGVFLGFVVLGVAALLAHRREERTRRRAEQALVGAYHSLEERVAARTRELAAANRRLTEEVAARREAEAQLAHDAFHDALTGLPNRALFMDRLGQAVRSAQRNPEHRFAVLFLDLDRFKMVNDSLGHGVGDALLVAVARRLQGLVRSNDTVARLGGDEFTVLLDDIQSASGATTLAERIEAVMREPIEVDEHRLYVTTSVGIAFHRGGGEADALLRDADIAMYRAKHTGKARYEVYEPGEQAAMVSRLDLEGDLRRALDGDELEVFYQPIVQLPSGRLQGLEALARWRHPQRGLLTPGEFIPLAEETDLVLVLGMQVLRRACRQVADWQRRFPRVLPLEVAVNLSSKQFLQADLARQVARILEQSGLSGTDLVLALELTETSLMENLASVGAMLGHLKGLGTRLAVDDFGTGYSSLAYLQHLPLDTLKVDRSFVARMDVSRDSRAIVRAVVDLAHDLGLSVVAEGVERAEHVAALRALGCDYAQGFHFARPMPAQEVEALLAAVRDGGQVAFSVD
jgi:diguanylate cyclase (GGDEF)-like protein